MLLGVLGAFIGGTLHTLIQTGSVVLIAPQLSIFGLILAVIGAIIAIFLYGLVSRKGT